MTQTDREQAVQLLSEHSIITDPRTGGALCAQGDWSGPWTFGEPAGHQVAVLVAADLVYEEPPPRCGDERLRPGGYPTRNWDWVKCDEDQGHDGQHENNETGLRWADDARQYL